jgi:hypothetical protein
VDAYHIDRFGSVDGIVLRSSEDRRPGLKEVLMQVRASSLNYRDLMVLKGGGRGPTKIGVVPLSDGASEVAAVGEAYPGFRRIAGCCGRSLGGEAFGDEPPVRRRFPGICRRGSVFFDLSEQPGLSRGGCPLSLRTVAGETASLEDYGSQLGDAKDRARVQSTFDQTAEAIAAYEASPEVSAFSSKFDAFLGGNRSLATTRRPPATRRLPSIVKRNPTRLAMYRIPKARLWWTGALVIFCGVRKTPARRGRSLRRNSTVASGLRRCEMLIEAAARLR